MCVCVCVCVCARARVCVCVRMAVNVDALEESDAVEKIASSRELRKTKVGLLPPPVSGSCCSGRPHCGVGWLYSIDERQCGRAGRDREGAGDLR